MIRRPPRSTRVRSSAASDVYKRQIQTGLYLETQPGAFYFTGTGGVLHREHPPFYWCLCFVLFSPTTNRQPSPQTTGFIHNSSQAGRFFPGFFFCGERTVLRRFLRFSRVLSLESSLSAHSCRLITRKSTTSRLGRSFDHPIYSRHIFSRLFLFFCFVVLYLFFLLFSAICLFLH